MAQVQLGVIEARFADMIWEREPVRSSELVKLAAEVFQWKRTTTHTVLKRLCVLFSAEQEIRGGFFCRFTACFCGCFYEGKGTDARRGSGDQTDH